MATVYVKSVSSYSRSVWDNSQTYSIGDRVSYDNGVLNKIYVCIQDHTTPEQPDLSSDYWRQAGSRAYPFYNLDGHLHATTNTTIEFNMFPALTTRLFALEAAGEDGTIVLLKEDSDPEWQIKAIPGNPGPSTSKNCTIVADKLNTKIIFNNYFGLAHQTSPNDGYTTFENFWLYFNVNRLTDQAASKNGVGLSFKNCKIDFQSENHTNQFMWGYNKTDIFLENCIILCPDGMRSVFYATGNLSGFAGAKNCTFYFRQCSTTHAGDSIIGHCLHHNNIYYVEDSGTLTANPFKSSADAKNNCFYDKSGVLSISNEDGVNIDPKFVSIENQDLRLRPNSPLIGGIASSDKRSEIENEYPQGKWFDSSAAAGGDGTWNTPYNNYAEAINSFTGDEAVVLIKKGQHQLRRGYWNGSSWMYDIDLPKSYPDGIKFIGMGPDTIFTTDSDVKGYGAFYMRQQGGPNLSDTPFTFKNFDILLNNPSILGRGIVCVYKLEMINVNVSQAPNLGVVASNLFDYTMSPNVDSGHYLKMSNCTINVSQSKLNNDTNFLVGGNSGKKQFKGCTFVDLDRTTSKSDGTEWSSAAPESFIHQNFGAVEGSYLHDCIIYSTTSTTARFGTGDGFAQGTTSLEIKNSVIFSTQVPLSIGSNFADNIKELDPKFVSTDPDNFDLRLRSDSPLIGGISKSKYSADTIWVNSETAGTGTGTESDPFHFNGGSNSQFLDAVNAAVSNGTFKVVFKDGNYRITTAGEQFRVPNLGLVTLVAENKDQAILSGERGINIGNDLNSQTLKLKDFKLTITGDEHFIHTQFVSNPFHLHLDNCYFLSGNFMALSNGSSIIAKNCIFEKLLGTNTYLYSGVMNEASFTNCLFVDRNLNGTHKFNSGAGGPNVFKNCIFRSEQLNNPAIPAQGDLIRCAVYNYDASNYSDEEVIFNGNPLMVKFDPTSHENSNYSLRPNSPLIGQGR